MAKRYEVLVMDFNTKEFKEKKGFDKPEDAIEYKQKVLNEDPLHTVVEIKDNTDTPENSNAKEIEKDMVNEQPKAKVKKIKTKSSYIEIDKNGKEWKITSSRLSRPLTTESVVRATGYLTRLCKRLDVSNAAHALEHAKNIGKHIIAGDTYGPNPNAGNAFTSPANRQPVPAVTTPDDYEVFCDTCAVKMVPDKEDYAERCRRNYTCPCCGWKADFEGVQDPSLRSDPMSIPMNGPTGHQGPSDYERGGNAFVSYSRFRGDGFTIIAVDEEKKEKKRQRESGKSTEERSAINRKLEDATKSVREYLVTVQVIQQEVKNYQKELMESLDLKELKKQSDLMEPAIKGMLKELAEHEKLVQGVEFRLKEGHKRTSLKSRDVIDPILAQIEKLVSKKNLEEFEKLRESMYEETPIAESFKSQLSKQSPEVNEEMEKVKKDLELLKTKKELTKEEVKEIEENENKGEDASKASTPIDDRVTALVEAGVIDEEIGKGLKESYNKDPKTVRKHLRKFEKKLEGNPKPETSGKEESKDPLLGRRKVSAEKITLPRVVDGKSYDLNKEEVIFINKDDEGNYKASWRGQEFDIPMEQIESDTESFPEEKKEASLHVEADLASKIKEYWEVVKEFFKEVVKPFTDHITISNAEWQDVNDSLDEAMGNDTETEEVKAEASFNIKKTAAQIFVPNTQEGEDYIHLIVKPEGEENTGSLWRKIEKADISQDILESWSENDDTLHIKVLTPDKQEAIDVIQGALDFSGE